MIIKDKKELDALKQGAKKLVSILSVLKRGLAPGVKTKEIEKRARELIAKQGAKPAFLGYKPERAKQAYPAALCVCVNEEIVHGIPGEKEIKKGDIVSLDLGINFQGYFSDMALTAGVGEISEDKQYILNAAEEGLYSAIKELKAGITTGDLGYFIQSFIEKKGLSVVKDLTGHGVGRQPHEPPYLPNWGSPGEGAELKEGMVLAVELMVSKGSGRIKTMPDGWTIKTADNSLSAHFEHTVLVKKDGAEILTIL